MAENIGKAQVAIKAFEIDYGAKYPKAGAKITDDADVLLEFFKYRPNIGSMRERPIPSNPLLPLCVCGRRLPGSRAAGPAMVFKLKGKPLERPVDITAKTSTTPASTHAEKIA